MGQIYRLQRFFPATLLAVLFCGYAAAGDRRPASLWNGFERLDFQVAGRDCLLVLPKTPASGRPWIWHPEFFGHEPQADVALLGKGFHAAYINVQNLYGAPRRWTQWMRLTEADERVSPRAQGGARRVQPRRAVRLQLGARHPDQVASLYVDAPVCDFKSWPGGKGHGKGSRGDWEHLQEVYGLSEAEALAYRLNPVDNLAPLAKAKIPILSVCGEADTVVPRVENTRLVQRRCQSAGRRDPGDCQAQLRAPSPQFEGPGTIVDFIVPAPHARHGEIRMTKRTKGTKGTN